MWAVWVASVLLGGEDIELNIFMKQLLSSSFIAGMCWELETQWSISVQDMVPGRMEHIHSFKNLL